MNLPDPIPSGKRRPPPQPLSLPTPHQLAELARLAAQETPTSFPPPPPEEIPTPRPPPPVIPVSSWEALELKRLLVEKAKRGAEGLKLYQPIQRQAEFHASLVRQRLLRGSNRSGKTLAAAVEVARALSGTDPYQKFPVRDGRCFAVGKNLDHVGSVMWYKLSRANQFKIIRDEVSGLWRAWRPWDMGDFQRQRQARPAPPLLPPRLIKSIAWENKAKSIPKMVKFVTGWELTFYSSEGKPPQGQDIDLWWFDEEIVDAEWYPEMVSRTLDRHGRGIWSATPQAGTEKLLELHERAEREAEFPDPGVAEFVTLLADNPYFTLQEKQELAASLSEEEQLVRIGGEFAINAYRVFPEFNTVAHNVNYLDIPGHWTRYAVVDPGRQICAVLFAAIPPPSFGDYVYIYDELYIQNCDAETFGQKMRYKTQAQFFEAFIIDRHGAKLTDIGSGNSVEQQYGEALHRNGVKSRRSGYGFVESKHDVEAGIEAVRDWLRQRPGQGPTLRIVENRCPNLEWEFKHYRYKRIKEILTDTPDERGRVHQMANMRYLALHKPRWRRPPGKRQVEGAAYRAFKQKQARKHKGKKMVRLGPGSTGD